MLSLDPSSLDTEPKSLPVDSLGTVRLVGYAAHANVESSPSAIKHENPITSGYNALGASKKTNQDKDGIENLCNSTETVTIKDIEVEDEQTILKKAKRAARKVATALTDKDATILVKGLQIFNVVNTSDVPDPDTMPTLPVPPHIPTASFDLIEHKILGPLRYMLVSKPKKVALMLNVIAKSPNKVPSIFIDLEGVNLGAKNGETCVMQGFHVPTRHLFLVDLHLLQAKAFTTSSAAGITLKGILGAAEIGKGIFDVRNDQAGLWRSFGIRLEGIYDIQLLAILATGSPSHRPGLEKVIFQHCHLSNEESVLVQNTKRVGKMLFAPERGGSYEVFKTRPMGKAITAYSLLDTVYLPSLCKKFVNELSDNQVQQALDMAAPLAKHSCDDDYEANGYQKRFSPWVSYDSDYYDD